jgi:hypothetical protein
MFAMKLTLILLGALLYLAGTCAWMLITFGLVIHIIKTARPAGSLDKPDV